MTYIYLFLQSALLELPVYAVLLARFMDWKRAALFALIMNTITHPLVFFGIMNLPLTYLQNILLAESFAIIAETLILMRFISVPPARAFSASVVANLVSWQAAPALTYFAFLVYR